MRHAFRIVNVFTVGGDRLSGNPLCVFEDASGMTDAQMQGLARQMNLSETTFLLPASEPAATARVRIFTPGFEMPFAGHPTLGTAHVVHALRGGDRIVLEMRAGLVPVSAETLPSGSAPRSGSAETAASPASGRWTLRAAHAPKTRPVAASRVELAHMLGLPDDAVEGEPLWVNTGVEQLVIPIRTPALVRAARPVPELIARHGYSESRDEAMAYLWSADPSPNDLLVRFFFTQHGAVIEDPATGSACANLGGWLIARNHAPPFTASLRQGEAVQRPSQLGLRVDADRSIHVTGSVIELGRGTLEL